MRYFFCKEANPVGELAMHCWASGLFGLAGLLFLFWLLP